MDSNLKSNSIAKGASTEMKFWWDFSLKLKQKTKKNTFISSPFLLFYTLEMDVIDMTGNK